MTTPKNSSRESRRIELEVEVPGTPEEVWEAIATGPGISAWLHPTEVEQRQGGAFSFDMGLGSGRHYGTVTGWDPPRRFVQEVDWQASESAPAARLATEWHVEARDGGTCVVRLVMSGFGSGAAWDEEIDGLSQGMQAALDSLRNYLVARAGSR